MTQNKLTPNIFIICKDHSVVMFMDELFAFVCFILEYALHQSLIKIIKNFKYQIISLILVIFKDNSLSNLVEAHLIKISNSYL